MKVICNGETKILTTPTTLDQLIGEMTKTPTNIAAAVNEQVISRLHWPATALNEGDQIDLFQATLGG